jgi:hypothetical protein
MDDTDTVAVETDRTSLPAALANLLDRDSSEGLLVVDGQALSYQCHDDE